LAITCQILVRLDPLPHTTKFILAESSQKLHTFNLRNLKIIIVFKVALTLKSEHSFQINFVLLEHLFTTIKTDWSAYTSAYGVCTRPLLHILRFNLSILKNSFGNYSNISAAWNLDFRGSAI